jgi:hypothetical protein
VIEKGRYRRKKDGRSVWVMDVVKADPYPILQVRRPKGAFYETKLITSRGFLARHEKVRDDGLR